MNKKLKYSIISFMLCFGICSNNNLNIVQAGDNGASKPTVQYNSNYTETYYSNIRGLSGDELLEGLATISLDNHQTYTTYAQIRGGNAYSDEDPSDPNYMLDFYTGLQIPNTWDDGTTWNREHVWCQSLSNDLFGESGAGSDIHHIRPLFSSINSARSNGVFRDLPNTETYEYYFNNEFTGCYRDSTKYFEPRDESKGDVARILMYLYMHYSTEVSANSSHSYSGNLVITNIVYTDLGTNQAAWDLLMDWNELDPVDTFESNRNNYCTSVTGLRNPFIDHPEFATMIWDSTYSGEGALEDTSISNEEYLKLSSSTLSLNVGNTYQVNPITNITAPSYTFTSSNTSIATISNTGLITALSAGETTITVTCNDLEASLVLTVKEESSSGGTDDTPIIGTGKTYQKVTSNLDDWTGEYLIVYETNNLIFNGSLETLDDNSNNISVTITNNTIELDYSNEYYFTISAYNSGYSIQSASGKYIGNSSDSNALNTSTSSLVNTITYNSGNIDIISSGGSYLRFNATSGQERFRYYKSSTYTSQKAIQLYKLNETTVTPDETLSLETSTLSLNVEDTYQVNPITNITAPSYTFTSSNTSVATISNTGLITALSAGETTITVTCNDLEASLILTVIDEFNEIKTQLENIETMAQLDFGYTYSKEGSSTTTILDYDEPATSATNMEADVESSELLNLDSSIFEVYATKKSSNANHIGLGKEGGTIRLYAGGNSLSIKCANTINYIEIDGLVSKYPIDNVEILVDGNAVSYTLNNEKYHFEINSNSFEISTMNTGTRFEFETIDINYGTETIDYQYFGNVNVRYSASIPNEIMERIDSYGVNFTIGENTIDYPLTNLVAGSEESTFALVLKNINDYTSIINVTAYVYVDGNRIELITKSYSIYTMVEYYINNAETLGLNSEQISSLNAFKLHIESL